jgi:thiosulfate/3-mercaptopyruvate sulfurtransferase
MRKLLSVLAIFIVFSAGLFAGVPNSDILPLVTVDWLNGHLSDKDLVVIEVHSGETKIKYSDEHIPGSVFASSVYFQKNMPTETNIPYDLPSKDEFEILARKLAINNDSRIVIVYPGLIPKDVMCATRTFWTFEYYGLSRVSILDGGLGAWKRAALAVNNIAVSPKYGNLAVGDENHSVLATLGAATENFGKAGTIFLDSRMASDYIGTTKQDFVPEFGHIPGSISYFAPLFLNPDLTFKNAKQVTYEMSLLGITKDKTIITYCNSGQFATTAWFALKEIAGMEKVSSFDGSVAEWVNQGKRSLIKG